MEAIRLHAVPRVQRMVSQSDGALAKGLDAGARSEKDLGVACPIGEESRVLVTASLGRVPAKCRVISVVTREGVCDPRRKGTIFPETSQIPDVGIKTLFTACRGSFL